MAYKSTDILIHRIRTEDGINEVYGIIIFSEDITRYKQAEEEIHMLNTILEQRVEERTAQLTEEIVARKESEQILKQYAAIIDSSEDAIISKTLEGIITSLRDCPLSGN